LASSRFPLTLLKPTDGLNACGAPCRTVSSANYVWPTPVRWNKPTASWRLFAPTLTTALPFLLPSPAMTSARYPEALIWLAGSLSQLPLPAHRGPRPHHPFCRQNHSTSRHLFPSWLCRAVVELSHQLDGSLRIYRADQLLHFSSPVARTRPTQTRHPPSHPQTQDASHLQPRWPSCFGCRHLKISGGDILSLQLIRHFMVASTCLFPESQTSSKSQYRGSPCKF